MGDIGRVIMYREHVKEIEIAIEMKRKMM